MECRACAIGDCPRHCAGCGYPVAHNPESCINLLYVLVRSAPSPEEG